MRGMLFLVAALCFVLSIITVVVYIMLSSSSQTSYKLTPYTGLGAGVYKHGTIVKIDKGQPVVVGHFDDASGTTYPGTVKIERVK